MRSSATAKRAGLGHPPSLDGQQPRAVQTECERPSVGHRHAAFRVVLLRNALNASGQNLLKYQLRPLRDCRRTIDAWRRRQPDIPSRAEAVRRLAAARGARAWSLRAPSTQSSVRGWRGAPVLENFSAIFSEIRHLIPRHRQGGNAQLSVSPRRLGRNT